MAGRGSGTRGGWNKARGGGGGNGGGNENRNGNKQGGAGAKTCNKCKKTGHVAIDCRSTQGKSGKYCTKCQMKNHDTADCTRGGKKADKQVNFDTALSTSRVTRPCRFCSEMHMDKDCPTKGGSGSSDPYNQNWHEAQDYTDPFGTPDVTPPCHHCSGNHLHIYCPKVNQYPQNRYQHTHFPGNNPSQPPPVIAPPQQTIWDACEDYIDEEFQAGDPWHDTIRYGPRDANYFSEYYQAVPVQVHQIQQLRRDIEGDILMNSMNWEYDDPRQLQ